MLRRVSELHAQIDQIHADELAHYSEIQGDEFKDLFALACPYSMVHVTGFYNVYQPLAYIRDNAIPGDLVECGCGLGGVAIFMRLCCERRLKSAARGGRKVQRWGWVESTLG